MSPKTLLGSVALIAGSVSGCLSRGSLWPEPTSRGVHAIDEDGSLEAHVEAKAVCIGARKWSAGTLGPTVLYRARRVGSEIHVGYFVYWSTERPWGDNVLSYTLLPALAVDAFYSHFLYVFPGVKDLVYGSGDVEGAMIVYRPGEDGTLEPVRGVADDGTHSRVTLSREDLQDAKGRVVLLTSVWSHQLGEHGGAALADHGKVKLACFDHAHGSLRPLTREVVREFRLHGDKTALRALPAWTTPEALDEVPDGPPPERALPRVARRNRPSTIVAGPVELE